MRNIRLTIAYDGTGYAGWQRQPNAPTIQGMVEAKIATMNGLPVSLHGAGRTDAGVHALAMVANFNTESHIPCLGFLNGLNSLLPDDIRVLDVREAALDFHARRSALGKTYQYRMRLGPVPIPTERLYSISLPEGLKIDAMRNCLAALLGERDFSSFEAVGSRDPLYAGGRGAVRKIFSARFDVDTRFRSGELLFRVSGDGFLRHMVRNIIGSLILVGLGKRSEDWFTEIVAARDRNLAGPTAPAHALFLEKVLYDDPSRG